MFLNGSDEGLLRAVSNAVSTTERTNQSRCPVGLHWHLPPGLSGLYFAWNECSRQCRRPGSVLLVSHDDPATVHIYKLLF